MTQRPLLTSTLLTLWLLLPGMALAAEMVSIAGDDINMRSGPSTQSEVLWKISTGFPLEIVSTKGEWLQVKDFEGSTGWVSKDMTQKTPYMVVKANKGTDNQISLFSEPNSKSKVVAKASYGVVFKTLEKKGAWIKVGHSQGVTGWVEAGQMWGF